MVEGKSKGKRRLDIECMRILAAFFVIFNHTETTGFFLFSYYDTHGIRYWLYLFISIFCKFSVPLFFMISGALMLNRISEPLKQLWHHRIFHMCYILITWSFFYYLVLVYRGDEIFNIKHFLTRLYDNDWNFSYWYLYTYISFLISLPLLQKITQNLSNKNYIYLFAVYAAYSMCLPSVQYLLWQGKHNLNENFTLDWLSSYIFIFPLAGYFFEYRVKEFWNVKKIIILWGINIGTILFSCYLTYLKAQVTGVCDTTNSQTFHSTFVLVNCVAIFVTIQYINNHTKLFLKLEKAICSIGECTFGIYLIHVFIRYYSGLTEYMASNFQEKMPAMSYAFLYCGVIFICSYVVTAIIRKIPILKKIVS